MTEANNCCKCSECELSSWCEIDQKNINEMKTFIEQLRPLAASYLALYGRTLDDVFSPKIPPDGV